MVAQLGDTVRLPCGLEMKNRLVKAALAEIMSTKTHNPDVKFETVYSKWSEGGWGMILTGNVMVDPRHCGSPGDIVIQDTEDAKNIEAWKKYARATKSAGSLAFVQLNHPGRQSPVIAKNKRGFFEKTLAPSPINLNIGDGLVARAASKFMFGTPKEMTQEDIDLVIKQFADGAKFVADAGFDGVEIHGAHGYLIAQFLSEKSNHRTDKYGGSAENRARFAIEIIRATRAAVPKGFGVGIKLNSADHQHEKSLEECLQQIALIVDAGIDFLEISGGTYEDPKMMQASMQAPKSARTAAREAFFLDFAHAVRARFPDVKLMVTGGFRSRAGMQAALADNACDIIGLGRPSIVDPALPNNVLLNEKIKDEDAQMYLAPVKLPWIMEMLPVRGLVAGAESEYYSRQIATIARGGVPKDPAGNIATAKI